MSQFALDILTGMSRLNEQYVFATSSSGNPVSGFSKAKAIADRKSGVAEWRLHDLRRTAGTNMARLGISTHVIARVLNHSTDRGVVGIYDRHSYLPEKRIALEKWAQKLARIINPQENVVPFRS